MVVPTVSKCCHGQLRLCKTVGTQPVGGDTTRKWLALAILGNCRYDRYLASCWNGKHGSSRKRKKGAAGLAHKPEFGAP